METQRGNGQKGFTLIELLGVAMILSVLTFISINLYHSVKARSQHSETRDRVELITAKIRQYYQTHERLPAAAGQNGNEVPVQGNALDMEQKYRLDAWGRYFVYAHDVNDPTNIQGVQDENGRLFAASIVSGGPDQNTATTNDNTTVFIDVTAEAKQITRDRLKLLQEKVAAYDALFAGIDNDGDGTVDDVGDVGSAAVLTRSLFGGLNYNTCPATNSFLNDPSEGFSTLDSIEQGSGLGSYNCAPPLIDHIINFYQLPGRLRTDVWGNPMQWGYEGRLRDDGSAIQRSDPRYHRFFSSGPDNTIIEDDIVAGVE